jgi:hypothetical protein
MLEEVLHRDRVIVVAALLSVVTLSWLWVALGAGMDMSAVEMTRMPRDMVMTPAVWTAGYAALMVSMWFVMMVAMMLPSATPMLLIFARVSRRERAAERPLGVDRHLRLGVSRSLGLLQCRGGRDAVGAGRKRTAVGNDGNHHDLARRRDPDHRRALADYADQACLPTPVPIARQLPGHPLARQTRWCVPDGPDTRCLLPGMLLDPDGAAVFWRCHEPLVGRGACSLCPARKDFADGPLAGLRHRRRAGRLGRMSGGERLMA